MKDVEAFGDIFNVAAGVKVRNCRHIGKNDPAEVTQPAKF